MKEAWNKSEIRAGCSRSAIIPHSMGQPQSRRPSGQIYSFGPFTVDSGRGALLRDSEEVKLRPKSFELLRYLAENPGRLVSKTELMQALWQDTVVGDDALPHCIMEARKALGDEGQRLIKTVPARGYIFEAKFNRRRFRNRKNRRTREGICRRHRR
jgi:DNA-binding winged helix-turn-helix (wHTH) protein